MPDNSGGFIVLSTLLAKCLQTYTYDHADVYFCKDCKQEFRWKNYRVTVRCIRCGSASFKLIRKKSEF